MLQLNLSGEYEEYIVPKKEIGRSTIKDRFRAIYGVDKAFKCKNCEHCIKVSTGNSYHYKCKTMGITASVATDIRLKDYGCRDYKEKGEK